MRKKTKLDIGWSDHSAKSLVVYKAIQKWKASFVELHIDLDGKGFEYKSGHCWLPKNAKELINFVKQDKLVDGNGKKKPNFEEISERKFRADKIDGLRPIRKYRK